MNKKQSISYLLLLNSYLIYLNKRAPGAKFLKLVVFGGLMMSRIWAMPLKGISEDSSSLQSFFAFGDILPKLIKSIKLGIILIKDGSNYA
jgi:hypothetical protein